MTIEERARAVVAYFPAIPSSIRRELEEIICRAIKRAVAQVLSELERDADQESIRGEGNLVRRKEVRYIGTWRGNFSKRFARRSTPAPWSKMS